MSVASVKRILVVGCGGISNPWFDALKANPRAKVAGLVDLRIETARAQAEKHQLDAPVFDNLKAALKAVRPDAVLDLTIPDAHTPTTVTALKAGVPVLGEKPMASSMASARKMVAAAEASGLLYMVSQSRRYDAKHAAIRDALRSGALGDVTSLNCDFFLAAHFGGFRDEMDSPLILDMSIHHFDLCRFFSDLDPVAVYAHEYNPKGSWYKGDVAASVVFEMSGGAVFTYSGSWCSESNPTSWHGDWRIQGVKGAVVYAKDADPTAARVAPDATPGFSLKTEPLAVPIPADFVAGFSGSLAEFLDALERGRAPQSECHDNIKSLAMVFAAIESSKKGKRVLVKY